MADHDLYNRSSKWLIQHCGDALLRLAGVSGIRAWRALQAEVVQPRQLPDGVLEIYFEGKEDPDYFLLEIATYPEERVREQVLRGALLFFLDRRVLPEVLVVVLHPKGNLRLGEQGQLASERGWAQLQWRWHVVELWTLQADLLLATNDPGVIPWVPLTNFEVSPAELLRDCRNRIDKQAPEMERANLLAVTQVMVKLRYNDSALLTLLGGSRMLADSPLIQDLFAERGQRYVLTVLKSRFPIIPAAIVDAVKAVQGEEHFVTLISKAAVCPDLESFLAAAEQASKSSPDLE